MSLVAKISKAEKFVPSQRPVARSITGEHDLPILAANENLPRAPGWAALMAGGTQPGMFLGAERRLSGKR